MKKLWEFFRREPHTWVFVAFVVYLFCSWMWSNAAKSDELTRAYLRCQARGEVVVALPSRQSPYSCAPMQVAQADQDAS